MWMREKMVPKCELFENIAIHTQGLNCEANICELEDHVGKRKLNSNWLPKLGHVKKTPPTSFPNLLL
jgi:hypothetical protein